MKVGDNIFISEDQYVVKSIDANGILIYPIMYALENGYDEIIEWLNTQGIYP
jgi:hypothetical protein